MLNIIYGTDGSDKDLYIKNKIKTAKDSVWILVPEQFSLSAEKSVIQDFGIAAQTRIKVITFSRLCNLVLSKLGPLRLKYIDGAGRQIIAARTIRAVRKKMTYLASAVTRRGFSSEIVSLVSEFKRYGVSAEMLKIAEVGADSDELSRKLEDIALILETFNNYMEESAADAEDNLALVCPKLANCRFLRGELFVLHFRSFTPVEYNAVEELMKLMDITVSICCDDIKKPSALFEPVAETCRKLTELAENLNVKVSEPIFVEDSDKESDLAYLRQNYFSSRPKAREEAPADIHILKLGNPYREAEAAADLIVRLCRTEKRRFSDFLILAGNTDTYNRIMPSVFASRGIDIFLDTRRSILTKPLTVMLCAALEIAAYGYSYDRVMAIARSGIIDVSDYDIDMFENYILAVSPTYGEWGREEWTYSPEGYDIESVNKTRAALCALPQYLTGGLSGRKTAKQICDVILKAFDSLKLSEKVKSICEGFKNKDMPYLADEYRQVWNSVISVLTQISALMDGENITWQDFYDLFKSACGGISVGLTPQTQGGVVFSQIDRFRSENTPIVVALGMNEGVFPAAHTSEGLISDAERLQLQKLGVRLAPVLDAKLAEEQLLVYSTLTAAAEKLYLFYSSADSDGAELNPSPIIKRIVGSVFKNMNIETPSAYGDEMYGAEGKRAAFDILCSMLAKAKGDTELLSDTGRLLYEYFSADAEYKDELIRIVSGISSPQPERLKKESVRAIYGDTLMLSASKLEKYNSCAFAYFMQYGLLAAEREKAGIKPQNMGSIQHNALYRYFSDIQKTGGDYFAITREDCYGRIYDMVREEAEKTDGLMYEASAYYKYIVTRMQGIAARTAWETVKFYRSSMFRPIGNELTIETGGDIPALSVRDEDDKEIALLRGRIDRADAAVIDGKNYISIVDYKSSETALDAELAAAGVKFQPLLYSDIICKRMKSSPAAMLYMQMTDPIINAEDIKASSDAEVEKLINKEVAFGGWLNSDSLVVAGFSKGGENGEKYFPKGADSLVSPEELERRIKAANEKIAASAKEIYEGNIKAEPYVSGFKYDACQYCLFGVSCGRPDKQ